MTVEYKNLLTWQGAAKLYGFRVRKNSENEYVAFTDSKSNAFFKGKFLIFNNPYTYKSTGTGYLYVSNKS
jgi:hypothetical protein